MSLACQNRCVFCAQYGLDDGLEETAAGSSDWARRLREARTEGAGEVTFVGGEPTLHPALPEAVTSARALGFQRIGVQTNGRRLADAVVLDRLVASGLTDVHLSLHGATAPAHDYHTGVDGSFEQTLAGMAHARSRGLRAVVVTVLTRSSCRGLGALPGFLHARGVAAWLVEVAAASGRAAAAFDRVVPRLGVALPFALHALSVAAKIGLPAWIRGAPLCLLGPFAARSLASEARAYAAPCQRCPARALCPGVDPTYLARFAGDELDGRRAPEGGVPGAEPAELANMFVGIGERSAAPAGEPPRPARVSLPLAGKVRPARNEAPGGTPRRTGGDLKVIFPGLFPDEGS
jgi:hypothetical protein